MGVSVSVPIDVYDKVLKKCLEKGRNCDEYVNSLLQASLKDETQQRLKNYEYRD